ncbi:hypothetical protein LJB92_01890 [Bacteroidales bacterium OttesenSCG-928-M06]|nr:hypothetical protein [Bacteroidales bacterium OttesenSCG-928-M06]
MEKLINALAITFDLRVEKIKGRKRYSRKVSHAKMFFCLFAYNEYRIRHCDIAHFLECPRTNVYHLLLSAQNNMKHDEEFRRRYEELRIGIDLMS